MADLWKYTVKELPDDNLFCYIRVFNSFIPPVIARYSSITQLFTVESNGLIIPAYYVFKWQQVIR